MLSPGQFHRDVPKGLCENLAYRLKLIRLCREKPEYRRAVQEMCKQDILFWINVWGVQYNPRKIGSEVGPFITYPFQDRAILRTLKRLYASQGDILWEKSREVGATWMALFIKDWVAGFHRNKKLFAISHTEDAVDRPGDSDSLFWKVAFIHKHIPLWLSNGEIDKRKLGFAYPTDSAFTGGATTERSGVGGRSTSLLLDEFSKHRQGYEILGQTADTGPRLFIGTHYGVSGPFYELSQRPDMPKVVMHWSEHPEKRKGLYRATQPPEILDPEFEYPPQCPKCGELVPGRVGDEAPCCEVPTQSYRFVMDGMPLGGPYPMIRSPWYDKECIRRSNPRDVAMHLDINPSGSVSQAYDPMLIRDLIDKAKDTPCLWEGDLDYEKETALPKRLVARAGGPIKLWINPDINGRVRPAPYVTGEDVSNGAGRTPSCLSLANARTGQKILEYADPLILPHRFAAFAVALARLFKDDDGNGAILCWEGHGPGNTFGQAVLELGYRNIYWKVIEQKFMPIRNADIPGWSPVPNNKDELHRDYHFALRTGAFVNPSEIALKECLAFKYNEQGHIEHPEEVSCNDPSGAKINHGDRVVADALCWKMVKPHYQERKAGKPPPVEELAPLSRAWRDEFVNRQRQKSSSWL